MFTALMPLIQERPVTIQALCRNGKLHLMIAPKKLKDDENAAYWTPFALTGTPEELDAGLAEKLSSYVNVRQEITGSLEEALEAAQAQMKKAAEEAKQKAAEKSAKRPQLNAAAKPATKVLPKISEPTESEDETQTSETIKVTPPSAAVVAEDAPQETLSLF